METDKAVLRVNQSKVRRDYDPWHDVPLPRNLDKSGAGPTSFVPSPALSRVVSSVRPPHLTNSLKALTSLNKEVRPFVPERQ